MSRRPLLDRFLAALFGGFLGGIIALGLFGIFGGFGPAVATHWLIWTPIPIGAMIGYWRGDRGIKGLIGVVRFLR